MTNLEFLRKHSYSEIISDTLNNYLDDLGTEWYNEETEDLLYHLKWLFQERKEKNVQLPEDNE